MPIDYEVYGAPETWQTAKIFDGSIITGLDILKASRPKVPNFDGNGTIASSQLRTAIDTGVITQNEPIDKSITPCGQDPKVSPWGSVAIYYNQLGTSSSLQPIKISEIKRDTPINWCFFENSNHTYGDRAFSVNKMESATIQYRVWSPDSSNTNNSSAENGTYYIAPFMEYQLKSILLSVQVERISSYTASGVPTRTWIAAEQWKTTYNTDKICGIRLVMRPVASVGTSLTQISYQTNFQPVSSTGVGAMLLDSIDVGPNDSGLIESFYQYGVMGGSNTTITLLAYIGSLWRDSKCYAYIPCYSYFDDAEIKTLRLSSSPYGQVWQEIPYSEDNYEKILKIAALFGCYFTPTTKTAFPTAFTDEDLYLPIVDDNGIAHGEYTHGTDNANNDLYNLDSVYDKGYNPLVPPAPIDPNTYSNTSHFKFVDLGNIGCKRYALSAISVNSLIGDLWSLLGTFSQDSFDDFTQKVQAGFLVTNPIDSIVSLMCFPFIVPNVGTDEPIKLGKYDMTARGTPVTRATYTINFNGVPLFPRFGDNYLDREPYTNYEIYVPFCGTIPLKAADILGHTLNVKLIVDLYTGSCTGYVLADDLVIETITGTVAITIPITGMDSTTINSQIVNANLNYKSSLYAAGSTIGSMVSISGLVNALSNPADAVNKIAQSQIAEEQAEYELKHIPTQPHMIGASSPALGWCCDTIARVMIYYPTGEVISNSKPPSLITEKINSFGHLNGFACIDWGKVSEYHGYTVGNVRLDNVPCTESERARIRQLFATGVVLP